MAVSKLAEIRCAGCKRKLGEYTMEKGQVRIQCNRSGCKTMNIVTVREKRTEDEPDLQNFFLNLAKTPNHPL